MSSETVMDKDHLAAFVDGELSPEDAAAVVMHLSDHPSDQAYVDNLMAANALMAQAFEDPMHEPVPAPIRTAIMGDAAASTAVPFRRKKGVWTGAALAMAASMALAAVILPDVLSPDTTQLALGPVPDGSELAQALGRLPSGVPDALTDGRELMILATVPVERGFCREVEVIDDAAARIDLGIACSQGAGWTVEVTVSEPLSSTGTEDGFVTASGTEMQGLQPFLDRLGAGAPLDPNAEANVIAQGWGS